MDKILFTSRYAEGDLSEREYVEFENTVKYDTELQEYLECYRAMQKNFSGQLKDALSLSKYKTARIEHHEEAYVAEELTYGLDRLWFAFVAIALLVGLYIWQPWKSDLYQQFKISEQHVVSELGNSSYQDFDLAAKFYGEQHYYEAKNLVGKLYMKNPEDIKLGYYYAVMLLENDCFETATKVLSPIFKSSSTYKYEAAYMMALSCLKQGNRVGCEEWLSKIPEGSNYYYQANELMAKLAEQSA